MACTGLFAGAACSEDCGEACKDETADSQDGLCRTGALPDESGYSRAFNAPGIEQDAEWVDQVQGLAHDGQSWYVTRGSTVDGADDVHGRLWKVPLDDDFCGEFEEATSIGDGATSPFCWHWGDPDVDQANGRIYVPLEQCHAEDHSNRIAEIDASNLEVLSVLAMPDRRKLPSIALDPKTGDMWLSGHVKTAAEPRLTDHLSVFQRVGSPMTSLSFVRDVPMFEEDGTPLQIETLQGIVFSPSGDRLYMNVDCTDFCSLTTGEAGATNHDFYVMDVSPERLTRITRLFVERHHDENQEHEAIDVLDTDALGLGRGQIHSFVFQNLGVFNSAGAWVKHIRVNDPRFTGGPSPPAAR